ncbi:MAG: type III-B CRISPR module RAMP protein Cmr6 [bacterium]|nr:type III-B CRISPR module RAMP protein Cmr6 [bacterium]
MIQAVRNQVRNMLPPIQYHDNPANLSLLFNRLCRAIDEQRETTNKKNTIESLLAGYGTESLQLYRQAFKRWKETLERDALALCFEMEVQTPLVVGKGDQNVHEFGISLQHPWGTPVIPGSAIKGVLSTYAHDTGDAAWQKEVLVSPLESFRGQYAVIMFGGTDLSGHSCAGCLDFMDAWWVPTNETPFIRDITTVHNRDYHHGLGGSFPDGTGDPVPIEFVVIKPGVRFWFTIRGTQTWCNLAKTMLQSAALEYGFGAKTRVGYGRLKYIRSVAEIRADMPAMTDANLAEVFNTYKGDPAFADAFVQETRTRQYNDVLAPMFRRFRPAHVFLHELQQTPPKKLADIKSKYDQYKKAFGSEPIDTKDPDIQAIFVICQRFAADLAKMPTEAWVWRFAPTAEDLIAYRTSDEVVKLIKG